MADRLDDWQLTEQKRDELAPPGIDGKSAYKVAAQVKSVGRRQWV